MVLKSFTCLLTEIEDPIEATDKVRTTGRDRNVGLDVIGPCATATGWGETFALAVSLIVIPAPGSARKAEDKRFYVREGDPNFDFTPAPSGVVTPIPRGIEVTNIVPGVSCIGGGIPFRIYTADVDF